MTLYLINSSVVLVGMACVLQLVHTGTLYMFLDCMLSHAVVVRGSYCGLQTILRGVFPFAVRVADE